jgi:uncharacterized protein DUF4229
VKEFVIYTGLRLVLFVLAFLVVAGVWMLFADEVNGLLALVIALVLSGIASYFLLNGPRDAFARRVEERANRASAAFEQLKAKEDDD